MQMWLMQGSKLSNTGISFMWKFDEFGEEFYVYIVPYLSDVKIRFFRTFKSLKFLQQIYM